LRKKHRYATNGKVRLTERNKEREKKGHREGYRRSKEKQRKMTNRD